jgi:hypothetical protein
LLSNAMAAAAMKKINVEVRLIVFVKRIQPSVPIWDYQQCGLHLTTFFEQI